MNNTYLTDRVNSPGLVALSLSRYEPSSPVEIRMLSATCRLMLKWYQLWGWGREGERKGEREGGRERGEGGREEGGKAGGSREEGREGGREKTDDTHNHLFLVNYHSCHNYTTHIISTVLSKQAGIPHQVFQQSCDH